MKRYGNDYGGYELPEDAVNSDSIIYSCGLGEDASFDIELVENHGCKIHIFDPTPLAVKFFKKNLSSFANLHFNKFGIWSEDGTQRFYLPSKDNRDISCSITNLQGTKDYFNEKVKRLSTIMKMLKHDRIDVLKMDIEGAEMRVIPDMIESGIRPAIICIELHRGAEYLKPIIENAGYKIICNKGTKTFIYENHRTDTDTE